MHPAGLTEATMWKQSGKMERYELALIAGVAVFLCGLIVFFERVLGAEPPTGFQSQPVPIFCGPATALREQLIKSQSRPIFTGQALDGAFMIFQPPPPNRSFMVTFWRGGSGCVVAAGTGAQIHSYNHWTMRGDDGSKKSE